MRYMEITSRAFAALLVAAVAMFPASAEALQASSYSSLPYVEDVNPSGSGYVATVGCAGLGKMQAKATCKGKRVKVRRVSAMRWELKMRPGKLYKVSVRAAGCKWKSIGYKVY